MSRKRNPLMASLLSLAAGAVVATGALAQPAAVRPGGAQELQAVYATAEEVTEGKRVAETACAGCHGINGISTTPDVPHIAGQRAAYLFLELKAYQVGGRGNTTMSYAIKFLNDDALIKVSAYYASLDPAQPNPAASAVAPKPDPLQAGAAAAAACAGCHGEIGVSKTPGVPSLTGFDPKYLVAAMNAYRAGQRKHDMMKTLLAGSSDTDVANMALFYALQKPARAGTPASGDQAAGKTAAAGCSGCHGDQGVSSSPTTPSLAGQDAEYFMAAIRAYKDGSRNDETMKGLVAAIDDTAGKNMAAYYTVQQPQQPPNVRKPLTTDEWATRCDRCHGLNGNSTDPRLPALAGQRMDYLVKVLHSYQSRTRKNTEMAAMSDVLSAAEVENLAAHYARQHARAVLYVPLPGK